MLHVDVTSVFRGVCCVIGLPCFALLAFFSSAHRTYKPLEPCEAYSRDFATHTGTGHFHAPAGLLCSSSDTPKGS